VVAEEVAVVAFLVHDLVVQFVVEEAVVVVDVHVLVQ
jgi:hypothetical protein